MKKICVITDSDFQLTGNYDGGMLKRMWALCASSFEFGPLTINLLQTEPIWFCSHA